MKQKDVNIKFVLEYENLQQAEVQYLMLIEQLLRQTENVTRLIGSQPEVNIRIKIFNENT